jgi:hypothetical protein
VAPKNCEGMQIERLLRYEISLTGGLQLKTEIAKLAVSAERPCDDGAICDHHSVATLLDAMAEPQPKVLKHDSMMRPSSSTLS